MKLVMEVTNGFGKIVNGEPIMLCFGSYIYKTHNYALFDDKAKVLLSDIDWLKPGIEGGIPNEAISKSET